MLARRLHSLGRSHDLLVVNRQEGAALADIVDAELGPFADRIRTEGPEIVLGPSATQTIAMILHELVTNAVKYGALSDPRGQVDLTWSVRQCDATRFALRWQESGGPPVKPPVRTGFGTTLLKSALREANARIDFQPEGLVYELEVPLATFAAKSSASPDDRATAL